MACTITYERGEFCRYLTSTLIPDLREDGRGATADDFMEAVKYIRSRSQSWDVMEFADYLSRTLIPDLMHSGRTCTADDFRMAVEFIMNPEAKILTQILS